MSTASEHQAEAAPQSGGAGVRQQEAAPETGDSALRAALRHGVAGLVALVVVAAVLGSVTAGMAGLWGALIGAVIGGFFILATAALVLFSAKLDSGVQGMVMLGGWVGKLLVVMIVVAVLKQFEFYNPWTLFLTVVGALLIVLGAETYGLLRQRVPVTELPNGRSDPQPGGRSEPDRTNG